MFGIFRKMVAGRLRKRSTRKNTLYFKLILRVQRKFKNMLNAEIFEKTSYL